MRTAKIIKRLGIFLAIFPLNVYAVDGYKQLKFGMSAQKILDSGICSLEEYGSGQPGVDYYGCDDFKFGGQEVEAGAFFIDGEFLRFGIMPSVEVALSMADGLINKYGNPSSSSSVAEFEAVDHYPNREAFLAFDNNTVYLKVMSGEDYSQSAILLYTSPLYDSKLMTLQKSLMSDDL